MLAFRSLSASEADILLTSEPTMSRRPARQFADAMARGAQHFNPTYAGAVPMPPVVAYAPPFAPPPPLALFPFPLPLLWLAPVG